MGRKPFAEWRIQAKRTLPAQTHARKRGRRACLRRQLHVGGILCARMLLKRRIVLCFYVVYYSSDIRLPCSGEAHLI